jgi:hypothetical protein
MRFHSRCAMVPLLGLLAACSSLPASAPYGSPPPSDDGGLEGRATDAGYASTLAPPPCDPQNFAALPRLAVHQGGKLLPYCTTVRLDHGSAAVTGAVLVVHGNNRDVQNDFSVVAAAERAMRSAAGTVIVAPYFQALADPQDAAHACPGALPDAPQPNDLSWRCAGPSNWRDGGDAVSEATSTFDAIDAMLRALRGNFPNLGRVTVTGFSAGGQLVQRYAAASVTAASLGVPVRFVVGDPGSFMYLDKTRLKEGAICADPSHCPLTTGSFDAAYFGAATCAGYSEYKYGLEGKLPRTLASLPGGDLRARYVESDVTYLVAAKDNGPIPGAAYAVLDVSCAADAQGPVIQAVDASGKRVAHSFRAQRALTFWHYVNDTLQGTHRMHWVAFCGHSSRCVYGDAGVRSLLLAP